MRCMYQCRVLLLTYFYSLHFLHVQTQEGTWRFPYYTVLGECSTTKRERECVCTVACLGTTACI